MNRHTSQSHRDDIFKLLLVAPVGAPRVNSFVEFFSTDILPLWGKRFIFDSFSIKQKKHPAV